MGLLPPAVRVHTLVKLFQCSKVWPSQSQQSHVTSLMNRTSKLEKLENPPASNGNNGEQFGNKLMCLFKYQQKSSCFRLSWMGMKMENIIVCTFHFNAHHRPSEQLYVWSGAKKSFLFIFRHTLGVRGSNGNNFRIFLLSLEQQRQQLRHLGAAKRVREKMMGNVWLF